MRTIIDHAMTAIAKHGPVPGTTTATPVPAPGICWTIATRCSATNRSAPPTLRPC
jgi:hypothetical protein